MKFRSTAAGAGLAPGPWGTKGPFGPLGGEALRASLGGARGTFGPPLGNVHDKIMDVNCEFTIFVLGFEGFGARVRGFASF